MSKPKQITVKTIKPEHLHTCTICKSDNVTVTSRYLNVANNKAAVGTAKCENCKNLKQF